MNPNLPTNNQFSRFRKYYTSIEPIWEKPKNRIYTAIIFSFLAISLFAWYAIRPTVQTILFLQKDIADKTIVNQKMEQKIAQLIEARANLDEIQPRIYLVREAIPENPDALDLSLQLRNLINSSDATMSSLTLGGIPLVSSDTKTKTGNNVSSAEFHINTILMGGYPGLESVLDQMNIMRRMITVSMLNFSLTGETRFSAGSTVIPINLTLKLNSYYK
jgi:cell division protein FtsB